MTPEVFIQEIRKEILDGNVAIYTDLLEKTEILDQTDPSWKIVLEIFRRLSVEEKAFFVGFIRQIMVDTLSNLFAILDGSIWLETQEDDFELCHTKTKLNSELQDLFLAIESDENA